MFRVYGRRKRSPFSSDLPALKLGLYFTGIAGEATAAICPVKRRFFSGKTPLTPLIFWFNAVNSAIFPVERR